MNIPPTWGVALVAAGVLGVAVWMSARGGRGASLAGRIAYVLAGGVTGFLAIAFPPAWPLLAFCGTLLVGMALRDRRPADVALLSTGFGATWTLMLGLAILNDVADPAVQGSPGDIAWFAAGATVLVAGLLVQLGLDHA